MEVVGIMILLVIVCAAGIDIGYNIKGYNIEKEKYNDKVNKTKFPKCYETSGYTYPFCRAARHPQTFAENDCRECEWSEDWLYPLKEE